MEAFDLGVPSFPCSMEYTWFGGASVPLRTDISRLKSSFALNKASTKRLRREFSVLRKALSCSDMGIKFGDKDIK